jgi:uncharacterized membrane protein
MPRSKKKNQTPKPKTASERRAEERNRAAAIPRGARGLMAHIRRFVIRGTLALIPLAIPVFAVYLLYGFIDRRLIGLVDRTFHISFPGLGIVLLIASLYLVGLIVSNVFGKQLLAGLESLTQRIPIVSAAYRLGKQLSGTFSTDQNQMFRRPVLVPYVAKGMWQVGFLTGRVTTEGTGEVLVKVYVPTPPNPTSGFVYFVKEADVRDPGWTVEEAMQCILSGGLIGPETIR